MSTLKDKAQEILDEKIAKIKAINIKDGVSIFDITGNFKGRNFYMGKTYNKTSLNLNNWGTQWKSADGSTNNHNIGDIGVAISDFELGTQRQPSDFETNGNWFVYLPKEYTFNTPITTDVQGSTTFKIVGSYDSVVWFCVDVDTTNNYYAIYLGRGGMHSTPMEYGLVSDDGIHFTMKKFNTNTYKFDIVDTDGIEIQPIYDDKTLCATKPDDDFTVFYKLKQYQPDFYNLVFGSTVNIKDNKVAEFNGTGWTEI